MEHIDSKVCMHVSNLPVDSRTLHFVSKGTGRNLLKRNLLSMYEGLNKIEEVFIDIIDILTKKGLKTINDIDYNVAGGKAINNIIKYKYL